MCPPTGLCGPVENRGHAREIALATRSLPIPLPNPVGKIAGIWWFLGSVGVHGLGCCGNARYLEAGPCNGHWDVWWVGSGGWSIARLDRPARGRPFYSWRISRCGGPTLPPARSGFARSGRPPAGWLLSARSPPDTKPPNAPNFHGAQLWDGLWEAHGRE